MNRKLSKFWNNLGFAKKVIFIYVIFFFSLYILSSLNGLLFNVANPYEVAAPFGEKYRCFYFLSLQPCSFGEYIFNSFIDFPFIQFVYYAPVTAVNIVTFTGLGDFFHFYEAVVADIIALYYLSIPIMIIYSLFRKKKNK